FDNALEINPSNSKAKEYKNKLTQKKVLDYGNNIAFKNWVTNLTQFCLAFHHIEVKYVLNFS
ncbi:MAG TPA: hypothetical protein VE445_02430, partial [Nitrososphaeraceae archaeon]|nr:hypothetical protein [Nitrososphaeraceae archaeon]